MNKKELKGSILLFITALIWGCAFVAQSIGAQKIGPFTFQSVRSLIGGLVLLPVIFGMKRNQPKENQNSSKILLFGGVVCGTLLCISSCLQQKGIAFTTVGKAGFITSLYILIVPVLGLFLGHKCSKKIWGCIGLAVIGLYLLCITDRFWLSRGDFLVLLCAIGFALHILAVDYFSGRANTVQLACLQFFVSSIVAGIFMVTTEQPTLAQIWSAWPTLLYTGALSCGVAYTLQMVGQKNLNPATASLIMSFEAVFAVLAGAVLLKEIPTMRESVGCLLLFAAILLAQIPNPFVWKSKDRTATSLIE